MKTLLDRVLNKVTPSDIMFYSTDQTDSVFREKAGLKQDVSFHVITHPFIKGDLVVMTTGKINAKLLKRANDKAERAAFPGRVQEYANLVLARHESRKQANAVDNEEFHKCLGQLYSGGYEVRDFDDRLSDEELDTLAFYVRGQYPQGYSYYLGDVCPHGMYTGGCGIDWICGPCEDGTGHPFEEDYPEWAEAIREAIGLEYTL